MWDAEVRFIHIDSAFQAVGQVDVVIAPGMLLGPDLQPLNIDKIRQASGWFSKLYDEGPLIAAAGTGGVIPGEAGLLRGRSYAITLWVSHMLHERYPDARPFRVKTLEEDRCVITSGGCFSWISLALYIIEKGAGEDVARLTSEMLLTDNHFLHHQLSASPGVLHSGLPFLYRAQ